MTYVEFISSKMFSAEAMCNDNIQGSVSSCFLDIQSYLIYGIGSLILLLGMAFAIALNGLYNQRVGLSKYDYLTLNSKSFQMYFNYYTFFVSVLDNIPYTSMDYNIYVIRTIITLVISLALLFYTIIGFVYRKLTIQKLVVFSIGIICCFDIALFLTIIDVNDENFFIVYFLGSCCIGYFILKDIVDRVADRIVNLNDKLETSEPFLFMNVFLNCFASDDVRESSKLFSLGMVANHFDNCKDIHCFCKQEEYYNTKKKRMVAVQKEDKGSFLLKLLVKKILELNSGDKKATCEWHINYAEFVFKKLGDPFSAIYHINFAESKFEGVYQKFRIFRLKRMIKTKIKPEKIGKEKEDYLEKVVEIEKNLTKIKHSMRKILHDSMIFWKHFLTYKQEKYHYIKKQLEETVNLKIYTDILWRKLIKYKNNNLQIKFYHEWFKRNILDGKGNISDDDIGRAEYYQDTKSVKSYRLIADLNLEQIAFLSDSLIIHVDLSKGNQGIMTKVSSTCINLTEYNEKELAGKNVEMLMPSFMKNKHTQILKKFTETGQRFCENDQVGAFLKIKNGSIIRVNILLRLHCSMKGDIEYIGLVREITSKKEAQYNYILMENLGFATEASQGFQQKTGLDISDLRRFSFNMFMLFRDLENELTYANITHRLEKLRKEDEENNKQKDKKNPLLEKIKRNMGTGDNKNKKKHNICGNYGKTEVFKSHFRVPLNLVYFMRRLNQLLKENGLLEYYHQKENKDFLNLTPSQFEHALVLMTTKNVKVESKEDTEIERKAEDDISDYKWKLLRQLFNTVYEEIKDSSSQMNIYRLCGKIKKKKVTNIGVYKIFQIFKIVTVRRKGITPYDPMELMIKVRSIQDREKVETDQEKVVGMISKFLLRKVRQARQPLRQESTLDAPSKNGDEEEQDEITNKEEDVYVELKGELARRLIQEKLKEHQVVIFKQLTNPFKKDEENLPNERLKSEVIIENILHAIFSIIIVLSLIHLIFIKAYGFYTKIYLNRDGLVDALAYTNYSLTSVEHYYTLGLIYSGYFKSIGDTTDTFINKKLTSTNLAEQVIMDLKVTQDKLHELQGRNSVRENLYFNVDERSFELASLVNSSGTIRSYNLSEYVLYTTMMYKMNGYLETNQSIDYFLESNFYQTINNRSIRVMMNEALYIHNYNSYYSKWNFGMFFVMIAIFVIATLILYKLSKILAPCISSLLVAFNFISDEKIADIVLYFRKQIKVIQELTLLEENPASRNRDISSLNKDSMSILHADAKTKRNDGSTQKKRRVDELSGVSSKGFRISIVLIILLGLASILTILTVILDYISYVYLKELTDVQKDIISEIIALKMGSAIIVQDKIVGSIIKPDHLKEVVTLFSEGERFSLYFTSIQNIYKSVYGGDVCAYLNTKGVISESETVRCKSVYRGMLRNGIKGIRETIKMMTLEIIGERVRTTSILPDELYELIISEKYCQMGLELLQLGLVNHRETIFLIFALLQGFVHLLMLVICGFISMKLSKYIAVSIGKEYSIVKKIYNHFIPDATIKEEKRLKAVFKQSGLLNN